MSLKEYYVASGSHIKFFVHYSTIDRQLHWRWEEAEIKIFICYNQKIVISELNAKESRIQRAQNAFIFRENCMNYEIYVRNDAHFNLFRLWSESNSVGRINDIH